MNKNRSKSVSGTLGQVYIPAGVDKAVLKDFVVWDGDHNALSMPRLELPAGNARPRLIVDERKVVGNVWVGAKVHIENYSGKSWTMNVDYDDGTPPEFFVVEPFQNISLEHMFATSVPHRVSLEVTDDEGAAHQVGIVTPSGAVSGALGALVGLNYFSEPASYFDILERRAIKRARELLDYVAESRGFFGVSALDRQLNIEFQLAELPDNDLAFVWTATLEVAR